MRQRMQKAFPLFLLVMMLVSACSVPTAPTEEERAAADAVRANIDRSIRATIAAAPPDSEDPDTATLPQGAVVDREEDPYDLPGGIGGQAFQEESLGAAVLEGTAEVDLEALYPKTLRFDLNDGCEDIYVGASLNLRGLMRSGTATATVVDEGFVAGLTDAVETVNRYGGPCGVELALGFEEVDSAFEQFDDVTALAAETSMPFFLATHNREEAIALEGGIDQEIINRFHANVVEDLLSLSPQVFYVTAVDDGWETVTFPVNAVQLTIAYQTADRADLEEGFVGYVLGYSAIFAVVELIQDTLNTAGLDGLGDQALLVVAGEEILQQN